MTIEQVVEEIEAAARQFHFIRAIVQVDVTRFSVKYRLVVDSNLYIALRKCVAPQRVRAVGGRCGNGTDH